MKGIIIYFSQTKNTEKVGKEIARGIRDKGIKVKLVNILNFKNKNLKNYDFYGFGFPVFYYQLPFNIQEFLNKMPVLNKPAFLFSTYGGNPGVAIMEGYKILKNKKMKFLGHFGSLGYDYFQLYDGLEIAKGHPDKKELKEARKFGNKIAEKLKKRKFKEAKVKIDNNLFYLIKKYLSRENIPLLVPKKRINENLCKRCGLCIKYCPTKAIILKKYPIFEDKKCIFCYHCEKICPYKAIECRWIRAKLLTGRWITGPLKILFAE